MTQTDVDSIHAYRGAIFHCLQHPDDNAGDAGYQYWPDGLLVVENGIINNVGAYPDLAGSVPTDCIQQFENGLIIPGLIDTHTHYPQAEMIGSYGGQLLDWLKRYTFPTEQQYGDYAYAKTMAEAFLDELLRNGTTTALVFATVHEASVEAFFEAAWARGLRMMCGKVMMDRNAPAALLDTPETGYEQSRRLLQKWHGKGRLQYAITARFAPTSSDEQLQQAGRLKLEFPDAYFQTHLSENQKEVEWVGQLFPQRQGYLDVYHHYGLTGPKSVFAHSVHLTETEWQRLSRCRSSIAHCPTSNLFLGSGLFNLEQAERHQVPVTLGTDVGAGTSFSMWRTMNQAYQVQQLNDYELTPLKAFYMATLGAAQALDLEHCIGNLEPGKEADFVVLDLAATPLLALRMQKVVDEMEMLFALSTLADDRAVRATFSMGDCVYVRSG